MFLLLEDHQLHGNSVSWETPSGRSTPLTLPQGQSDLSIEPSGVVQNDPYSVAGSIINQIDPVFVQQGVKFVIQVGDLTDCGTTRAIQARASLAQQNLIANGIDFFPVRGNHETYANGTYNETTNTDFSVTAMKNAFPQMTGNGVVSQANNFVLSNVGVPSSSYVGTDCLSYSFDYGNVRFLMLDFWVTSATNNIAAAGYNFGYQANAQQAWITQQLQSRNAGDHAFVITHQPLMAEDHVDTIFTGYTNANPTWQNAFYQSLQSNNVGYYLSGHDHMHQRSIIQSPDSLSQIQELICASCSNKFYTPVAKKLRRYLEWQLVRPESPVKPRFHRNCTLSGFTSSQWTARL